MGDDDKTNRTVSRDEAWVRREYGRDKWPIVLAKISELKAANERSLARAVATIERWEWGTPDLARILAVAGGVRGPLPASLAWYGSYALIAEAVLAACREDTSAIIELGCGWGRSLFEIWLRGGPPDATYHALEFTDAGLECVKALADLEQRLAIALATFDFRNPDFSSIPKGQSHAVVFTVSSLHQVPEMDEDSYRAIALVADDLDCLHFEQIGWQIEKSDTHTDDRDYATRNDYNRNLWTILERLDRERTIDIVNVQVDLVGTQQAYPMSLVHWRKRR